jgi:hypothetical protein
MINKDYCVDAAPLTSCYARYANDNNDVKDGNNAIFEEKHILLLHYMINVLLLL